MRKIFGERLALFIEEMKEILSKYPDLPKIQMAIIRDIDKTNHKKNATVYHCALLLSIPAEAKDKIL